MSMPGVVQHTQESLRKEVRALAGLGVPGGDPLRRPRAARTAPGSGADDRDGVVQVALRSLRDEVGDSLVLMADTCLDEYTDHGHCGLLDADGEVDNDATLERYASIAIAQADAGADVIAPSGMMDGQVGAIRAALDGAGHTGAAILAYSAKYASGALRTVPRRGRVRAAVRRPARLPDAARQRPRGARRDRARHRAGRRHGDGQARALVPRRDRGGAQRVRRPGRGVPRERRVRDGAGRRGATAGSTAPR